MPRSLRVGSAAQLSRENPVLDDGQLAWEADSGLFKAGNGQIGYGSLAYLAAGMRPDTDGLHLVGSNGIDGALIDKNGRLEVASARQRSHNLIALTAASATAVHAAVTLTAAAQTVTATASPDFYRAVSVKGNASGIAGNVIVIGKDQDGRAVSDTIALSGTSTVAGVVPFSTVTNFILPAKTNGSGDTVSVGVANVFGLGHLIAATTDVLLVERIATGAWGLLTVSSDYTVDATNSTVTLASVSGGDDVRISYRSRYL